MAKDISPRVRKLIYKKYSGWCFLCGGYGEEIHHIIPRSEDESLIDEPSNLVLLCKSCHYLVTNVRPLYWKEFFINEVTKKYGK